MVSETLRLSAHEKFIIDGIKRQAGTVEKAVLELLMNAIEAQLHSKSKPVVHVSFSVDDEGNAILVVKDLGRGFKSRNEIEQWFAKFGTPHDECPKCQKTMKLQGDTFVCRCGFKTEGRTWAEFRMGRGQAFSFGRNVWRTGKFRMEYDLETAPDERTYSKKDGTDHVLDMKLDSDLPLQKGCEVTVHFYKNPIGNGYKSLDHFKDSIKHHVEFMEGEIFFNGERINTPASECKWDVETGDAFFMFGKGNKMEVYNIGAFVKGFDAADMGVTGVAVSKSKMLVNFARNDVMQSCSVWERIQFIIRENKIKKVRHARRRLDKDERLSTLRDLHYGDVDYDVIKTIGLLELTDGKVLSLDAARKIRSPWTFAPVGDRVADRLMQVDEAICFSQDMLDTLNYSGSPQNFFKWLFAEAWETPSGFDKIMAFFRSFKGSEGLSSGYKDSYLIVPTDKLSKGERCWLRVMEDYGRWKGRTLCIGVSDTANGWTDGKTYIAFNRAYLQSHDPRYHRGAAALATLAMHEMAHDDDDTGTHNHNVEFYQKYHEITRGSALDFIGSMPHKMRNQKWEDHATEVAEKDAKKKAQRDKKLGIKRVVAGQKKAADGIAHTPAKKVVAKAKVAKRKIRRF